MKRSTTATGYRNRTAKSAFPTGGNRRAAWLWMLVLGGILGFCTFKCYKILCRSDFFQITAINIQGCRMTRKDEILRLSGIDIHTNLLAMNAARVKTAIESNSWIEQVDITREWPSKLTITVKEWTPLALLHKSDGLYYVDKKGKFLAPLTPTGDMDFPVISGEADNDGKGNSLDDGLQDALLFLKYAGKKGNVILPQQNISEIHITADNKIIIYLLDEAFPIYLGTGRIGTQYYRLVKILRDLYKRQAVADTAYIRMNYMKDKALVGRTGSG